MTTTVVRTGGTITSIDGATLGLLAVRSGSADQPAFGLVNESGFVEIAPGSAVAKLDADSLVWQTSDTLGRGPVVIGNATGEAATSLDGICWSTRHQRRPPTCRPGEQGIPGEVFDLAVSKDGTHVAGTVTTATPDLIATTRLMIWTIDGSVVLDAIVEGPPETRLAWVDYQTVLLELGDRVAIGDGNSVETGLSPTAVAGDGTGSAYVGTADGAIWVISPNETSVLADSVHDGLIDSMDVLEGQLASFGNDGFLVITDVATGTVLRRIPVGSTGGSVAWADQGTVALAKDDRVVYFEVEPVDVSTLAVELITRSLTEAECETYLQASCDEWSDTLADR